MKKFSLYFGIISLVFTLMYSCSGGPRDPRDKLIKEDMDKLDGLAFQENDSIAQELKLFFDSRVNKKLDPEDFSYFTRISDDNKRILVLIKMPKMKKVEKGARMEAVDLVEEFLEGRDDLRDKELYMGVKGRYTLMVIKTPTYEYSGKLGISTHLYDFYGPRENFEAKK